MQSGVYSKLIFRERNHERVEMKERQVLITTIISINAIHQLSYHNRITLMYMHRCISIRGKFIFFPLHNENIHISNLLVEWDGRKICCRALICYVNVVAKEFILNSIFIRITWS